MSHSLLGTAAALLIGCSGSPTTAGLEEPLRVASAQFISGSLPGTPPLTAQEVRDGVLATTPRVTSFSFSAGGLRPGSANNALRGRASADAAAVAIGFLDAGSGYWVLPVSGQDPSFPGEFSWSTSFDVGYGIAPGLHELRLAAIGLDGESGTQESLKLCINSPVPDNSNACLPTRSPPHTVVSLTWDTSVDLDLRVLTPSGKFVDAKHPTSALPDANGKIDPSAPGTALLQRDGGLACSTSGGLREDLVFNQAPAAGRYQVFANLYDSCGANSVRFQLSFWSALAGDTPGTFTQQKSFELSGITLGVQASQGSTHGQFLTEFIAL